MTKEKKLYIIGAGGFGRQLESYLDAIPVEDRAWKLIGYLDDNPNALNGKYTDYGICGKPGTFDYSEDDMVVMAIAHINTKRNLIAQLKGKVAFLTYIDPSVILGKNVTLGEGVVICPGVKLGSNIKIGDHALVNLDSIVGHDSEIGNFCSIMTHVDIGGNSRIDQEVYIGTKVAVAPGTTIVSHTHLGVGAIIIKDIQQKGTYFGNPARRML